MFFLLGFQSCECYIDGYNNVAVQPMITLKVTTVGNSAGVIFPKELMEKLRISKGDTLYVLETPNGLELTPYDPEFIQQMEVAEEVMREDRSVLRKLAT